MRCSVAKWLTNAGHDAAPPTPISISASVISSCFHLKKRENSQKAMVSTCFTAEPPRCPKLGACESTVDRAGDRKSTRLNSSHVAISYAVFCLKKKKMTHM